MSKIPMDSLSYLLDRWDPMFDGPSPDETPAGRLGSAGHAAEILARLETSSDKIPHELCGAAMLLAYSADKLKP
jgi:hypothetical protein